jgi:hypothetical protein
LVLEVLPHTPIIKELEDEEKKASYIALLDQINANLLPFQRVSKIILRTQDFARTPSMKIIRPSQSV